MDQKNLMTDAADRRFSNIYVNTSKITYKTVADIESELDYYEKVALVFLLYDQPDNALQSLLSTNIKLCNWVKSKHLSTSSWQDRLMEALCVIQNYGILRRFGFDNKDELKERYLPTRPYASLHLNKVMKALYCICEQLSVESAKMLILHLAVDFRNRGLNFRYFDENCLEIYLLHCFSVHYISTNNLSNLIAILKKMGLSQEAATLELAVRIGTRQDYNVINENNNNFDLTKPSEKHANLTAKSCPHNNIVEDVSSSDCYVNDPENVGICLIINQKEFHKENKRGLNLSFEEETDYLHIPKDDLKERDGTDVDKVSLSEIFKELGFRIIVHENLNNREMIPKIKEVMKTFSNKDCCFVVCILSHGVEDKIYGSNSIPININDIKEALHDRNCTALLGKPKILIIQACQGTEIQKVPEKGDLLVCMSTGSGFTSIRDPDEGTWYIQELCKTINEKCEREHIEDILRVVNEKLRAKRMKLEDGSILTMVPESISNFSKKLYLRKVNTSS